MSGPIVILGDLHADWRTRGFDRLEDGMRALRAAVECANDLRAAALVFVGDFAEGHRPDERIYTILGAAQDELERCRCWVGLVAGNHDVVDRPGLHCSMWPLRSGRVEVIEDVLVATVEDGLPRLLFLPHVSKSRVGPDPQAHLDARAEELIRQWGEPGLVAVAHLDPPGARGGSEADMVAGERLRVPDCVLRSTEVNVVVCGHVHEAQDVPRLPGGESLPGTKEAWRAGGWDPLVHVVGSAERLTFNEEGQPKSLLVVDPP